MQAGEGAGEEVLREARGVRGPEEDPGQAHQEVEQAQAEAAQVPHPAGKLGFKRLGVVLMFVHCCSGVTGHCMFCILYSGVGIGLVVGFLDGNRIVVWSCRTGQLLGG